MKVSRAVGRESGLTLLELVVVTAILGLMSAIISLSVTGRSTQSRGAIRETDVATIQRAMDAFVGEHPQARHPTLNGCPPDRILDLITGSCVAPGNQTSPTRVNTRNLQFTFEEASSGADLNGDGDSEDSYTVVPILWHKAFKQTQAFSQQEEVKRFLLDFVRKEPKHAFEFLAGADDSWKDGENFDPDDLGNNPTNSSLITAPSGLGPGENRIDPDVDQVPVWVIGIFDPNSGLEVRNLLPESRY